MSAITQIMPAVLSDGFAGAAPANPRIPRKWPISYQAIEPLFIGFDIAAIFSASLLAELVIAAEGGSLAFGRAAGLTLLVSSLFVGGMKICERYRPTKLLDRRDQIRMVAAVWASVIVLLAVTAAALNVTPELPHGVGLFIVFGFAMLVLLRVGGERVLQRGLIGQRLTRKNVLLVAEAANASTSRREHAYTMLGYSIAKTLALPPSGSGSAHRKRFSAQVIDYVRGRNVDEIVIEADLARWSELRSFLGDLRVLPLPVSFIPVGVAAEIVRLPKRDIGAGLCLELQGGPLSAPELAAKRMLDVFGAGFALLVLSPIFALAALAVKLESPGPIFFRQQRCGFNGQSFAILKFRTMTVQEDGAVVIQARRSDSRVTGVGKWLRRLSVDELPQLLNVLQGSMSLMGPRPHALAHDGEFDKKVRNYAFRRRVKPGLTGWAQIKGCRGATPTTESIERRVEYDLWYIDNWSLKLDIAILLRTPFEVLRARNAF